MLLELTSPFWVWLGFCQSKASWIWYALLFGQITVCLWFMLGTTGRMSASPVKLLYFEVMKIKKWCWETRNEEVLEDFLDASLVFPMVFISDDYIKALSLQTQKWKIPVFVSQVFSAEEFLTWPVTLKSMIMKKLIMLLVNIIFCI